MNDSTDETIAAFAIKGAKRQAKNGEHLQRILDEAAGDDSSLTAETALRAVITWVYDRPQNDLEILDVVDAIAYVVGPPDDIPT